MVESALGKISHTKGQRVVIFHVPVPEGHGMVTLQEEKFVEEILVANAVKPLAPLSFQEGVKHQAVVSQVNNPVDLEVNQPPVKNEPASFHYLYAHRALEQKELVVTKETCALADQWDYKVKITQATFDPEEH